MTNFQVRKEGDSWVIRRDGKYVTKGPSLGKVGNRLLYKSSKECLETERPVSVTTYYPDGSIIISAWTVERAQKYHDYLFAKLDRLRAFQG